MEVSGDNWSDKSCKAPVKCLPPTKQHPTFYRPDALPVAQPTVSEHWRESCTMSDRHYGRVRSLLSCGASVCGTQTPARHLCRTEAATHSRELCVLSEMNTYWQQPATSRWLTSGRCSDRCDHLYVIGCSYTIIPFQLLCQIPNIYLWNILPDPKQINSHGVDFSMYARSFPCQTVCVTCMGNRKTWIPKYPLVLGSWLWQPSSWNAMSIQRVVQN